MLDEVAQMGEGGAAGDRLGEAVGGAGGVGEARLDHAHDGARHVVGRAFGAAGGEAGAVGAEALAVVLVEIPGAARGRAVDSSISQPVRRRSAR
jgi:hypothetical protein